MRTEPNFAVGAIAHRIAAALTRARCPILTIAVGYMLSLVLGIAMVRTGNEFALASRDAIVADAIEADPASQARARGEVGSAVLLDFARNVAVGALPTTVMGLAVVMPYPFVAYRGWVGGIVSSRADHSSRLDDPASAAYYLSVIFLQLLPYSLTGGAGVALGLRFFRRQPQAASTLFGLPRTQLADVAWIYALAIPLFVLASLIEFLAA